MDWQRLNKQKHEENPYTNVLHKEADALRRAR